jgi:hypothetical protein
MKRGDYILLILTIALLAGAVYVRLYIPVPTITSLLGL